MAWSGERNASVIFWCVVLLALQSFALQLAPFNNNTAVHVLQPGIFQRKLSSEAVRIEIAFNRCGLIVWIDDKEAAVRCFYDGPEVIGFVAQLGDDSTTFKIIDSYLLKSLSGSLWVNHGVYESEMHRRHRFNSTLSGEVLISYVVHSPRKTKSATSTQCSRNLAYFLENGVAADSRFQYIISLVGDTPFFAFMRHLNSFDNVLVRRSPNYVVDLVVHGHVLPIALQKESFKFFLCINCGSRGPFASPLALANVQPSLLPYTSNPKSGWIAILASKLGGGVRAVGPTISCDFARHIQSYAMAFDRIGAIVAQSVWSTKLKKGQEEDKNAYIRIMEVGLSVRLQSEGHSITSLSVGKDFNCSDRKYLGNPTACLTTGNKSSLGCKGLCPCECVFVKYGNNFRSNNMPAATLARVGLEEKMRCQHWIPLEAPPRRPSVFILLTATVFVNFRTPNYTVEGQQTDPVVRRRIYEQSIRFWALNSSLPVTVVENSGADLAFLRRLVPVERRSAFEFFSVKPRNAHDIGSMEASAVLDALNSSVLLQRRRANDLVFKITGRYQVLDFYNKLSGACLTNRSSFPGLVVNRPDYYLTRQETTLIGFNKYTQSALLDWAENKNKSGFEVHAGNLVKEINKAYPYPDGFLCSLPKMPIVPVQEGSTSTWRDHV